MTSNDMRAFYTRPTGFDSTNMKYCLTLAISYS